MSQPSQGSRHAGFTVKGDQTLYTAYNTGRTYDAHEPPSYPCITFGGMHWSWQPCLSGMGYEPGAPPAPTPTA